MKVVLICGTGRSGTTVFGRAISHLLGAFNVGELIYLNSRSLNSDQLCGCGKSFSQCDFWSNLLRSDPAFAKNAAIVESNARWRFMPAFILNLIGLKNQRTRSAAAALSAMYKIIAEQSSSKTIVDSSKMIPYAFLMMNTKIDVDYLLVVRNLSDVVRSTQMAKFVPEWGREDRLHKRSAAYYTAEWLAFLVFLCVIRLARRRSFFLGYKRYVVDHVPINKRIWSRARSIDFSKPVDVESQHDVGGNPNRFAQTIQLKRL